MNLEKQLSTLLWGGILFAGTAFSAMGQTIYTWSGASGGNWSATANWTAPGNPGSAGAGTTDSATLNNIAVTTGTYVINYDAAAGGTGAAYLDGLSMIQTSAANIGTTQLSIAGGKTLTLLGNSALYDTTTNGAGEVISLGSGSVLNVGNGVNSAMLTLGSTTVAATSPNTTNVITNGSLNVNANAVLQVANDTASTYTVSIGSATTLASGGIVDLQNQNNSGVNSKITFNGAFNSGSGSGAGGTFEFSGSSNSSDLLAFQGDATLNGGTTFVTAASLGGTTTALGLSYATIANVSFQPTGTTEAVNLGTLGGATAAFNFQLRNFTASSSKTVTVTTGTGTTIGLVGFNLAANSTLIYKLGSNLTLDSGVTGNTGNYAFYIGNGGLGTGNSTLGTTVGNIEFDLSGHSYDIGNFSGGYGFGAVTTVGSNAIYINNSSTTTAGTFKAQYFTLGNNENYVGSAAAANAGGSVTGGGTVVLWATTAGRTNDLGTMTGGSGTMASGTLFQYSGTGSANLQSNRTLGAVQVGVAGSTGSTLALSSAVTAAGNVTPTTGNTLDLNNKQLALSGAANLGGGGTVANTGGTAAGNAITFGTGGLAPGGGVAGNTSATLTLGSNVGVTLNAGSTSVFNIASGTAYDEISGGTLTLGGTLVVNFLSGFAPTASETFSLFGGSTLGGTFSSIAFENAGAASTAYSGSFSAGVLTVNAVPEPPTSALLLGSAGIVALGLCPLRRRPGLSLR